MKVYLILHNYLFDIAVFCFTYHSFKFRALPKNIDIPKNFKMVTLPDHIFLFEIPKYLAASNNVVNTQAYC